MAIVDSLGDWPATDFSYKKVNKLEYNSEDEKVELAKIFFKTSAYGLLFFTKKILLIVKKGFILMSTTSANVVLTG